MNRDHKLVTFGYKYILSFCVSVSVSVPALADKTTDIINQQQIHQELQRQAREDQLLPKSPDIHLDTTTMSDELRNFPIESPCFPIKEINIENAEQLPRWLRLTYFVKRAEGNCLGGQGIKLVMSALQNRLVSHGYVTARVLASNQDLTQGTLTLTLLIGQVNQITKTSESDSYLTLYNTVPARGGSILNLRDIEQGIENLQRIPTGNAEINLVPSEKVATSDIEINWHQKKIWRLAATLDDSGSESTGRYQGGLTLYLDNPTSLGDIFYISAGHDINSGNNVKGSKNYTVNYTIPYGYWFLSLTASRNNYDQNVSGAVQDYLYSGKNQTFNARLSRLIHRDNKQKSTLFYEVMRRNTQNYIDHTEVEVQRRTTAGWKIGLQHRHYFQSFTVNSSIDYQQGTRWFGAQPAAEEIFNEATALSKIIHINADLEYPFQLFDQSFSYTPRFQAQIARSKLTPQDRISLGGRWSVRGFDGELTLSADNGWFLRNDLNWMIPMINQQFYLGADYGVVSGGHSEQLIGKRLMGGVMGIRGYFKPLHLNYETFAGMPIAKPNGFQTSPLTLGFSLYWEY